MQITIGLVFFVALLFSLAWVTKVAGLIGHAIINKNFKIDFMQMMFPALFWSIFYVLVNWK